MKLARHEKIIELIKEYDIDTQEELAARLNEAGFKVTQATVSRDIRALKMTKVAGKDGKSRYAILQDTQPGLGDQYTRVLNDAVVSIEVGQNLVVIKNSYRNGNGSCHSSGCLEMAGNPGLYCRR